MSARGLVDDLRRAVQVRHGLGVGSKGHDEDVLPERSEGEEVAAGDLDHGRVDRVVRFGARRLHAGRAVVDPGPGLHRRAGRVANDGRLASEGGYTIIEYIQAVDLDYHGGLVLL